jgi:putative (di)nucleoside polyphosphate hydrolase
MEKKYRPNAAVIVTDGQGRVLLCHRLDGAYSQIQTVQGGIDAGETPREAAIREVGEEIGLLPEQFSIIAELPGKFRYEWPVEYQMHMKRNDYIGQEQQYFLALVAPDAKFDLTLHSQEFASVVWGTPEELVTQCWEVKRPGITAALQGFGLLPGEQTS